MSDSKQQKKNSCDSIKQGSLHILASKNSGGSVPLCHPQVPLRTPEVPGPGSVLIRGIPSVNGFADHPPSVVVCFSRAAILYCATQIALPLRIALSLKGVGVEPMSVFWRVCFGECVLESVFWRVCFGECVLESVFWRVCFGECVWESVFWRVCFGECVFRRRV